MNYLVNNERDSKTPDVREFLVEATKSIKSPSTLYIALTKSFADGIQWSSLEFTKIETRCISVGGVATDGLV